MKLPPRFVVWVLYHIRLSTRMLPPLSRFSPNPVDLESSSHDTRAFDTVSVRGFLSAAEGGGVGFALRSLHCQRVKS